MEEIDLGQLLGYFKSKIIYIIFAMSIAFCLSSIYVNRFRVPEYTSYTTILLNKTNQNESISSTDVTLGKSLITTYGEIIKSKRVLRTVINNLSLGFDYGQLASKVNVSEVTDTSIIKVAVTDKDSAIAADIANEIADVFTEEIVEIYNIENISIIDVAEVTEVASSTSTIKIIGVATLAGAFISIAIIFVVFYFDTTIKNEEDIERATNLPVIGIVPISREKIKGSAHRKYYENQAKKHKTQEILPVEREVRRIDIDTNVDTEEEIGMKRVDYAGDSPEKIIELLQESKEVFDETSEIDVEKIEEADINEALNEVTSAIEEQEKTVKKAASKTKAKTGTTTKKSYYKKNSTTKK